MRIVRINRLFHGKASVRDYLVKEAQMAKEGIVVQCNGERMTIPFERLSEGTNAGVKFKSQHDNREYGLIDFKWAPDNAPKLF